MCGVVWCGMAEDDCLLLLVADDIDRYAVLFIPYVCV